MYRQGLVCFLCVALLLGASAKASFHEDELLESASFLDIGSDIACKLAKCLRGQCVNSSSFPFYKCECNAGWQSPFGASWLPCMLPNCSIDLTCANRSAAAPAPSAPFSLGGGLDICSFHVCGNGACIHNSSSTRNGTNDYECLCDSGYINFASKADGYCIRQCSLGTDCTNVSLPIGGSSNTPPPPPPAIASPTSSASSPSVNQGRTNAVGNIFLAVLTLIQLILWR